MRLLRALRPFGISSADYSGEMTIRAGSGVGGTETQLREIPFFCFLPIWAADTVTEPVRPNRADATEILPV
jgi:hypothetical protein